MISPESEFEKLASCLTIQIKREKLSELYELMHERGMVSSQKDFGRKVDLSCAATYYLMHDQERSPVLRTLRAFGRFILYWLGKDIARRQDCTLDDLADRLLETEELKGELLAKLSGEAH